MADGRKDYTWLADGRNALITPWDGAVIHPGQKVALSERELEGLRRAGHHFAETEPAPDALVNVGSYVDEQSVLRTLPRDHMGNPLAVEGGHLKDRKAAQLPQRRQEQAPAAAPEATSTAAAAAERK